MTVRTRVRLRLGTTLTLQALCMWTYPPSILVIIRPLVPTLHLRLRTPLAILSLELLVSLVMR